MTVKQISVFVENKPGKLTEFTKLLEKNHIDMRALSVAETEDFGILRIIVDDVYDTIRVLKDANYVCSVTDILAVELPDQPGSLAKVLSILSENDINVEYTYAFVARKKDAAYMIFRVSDNNKAIEALNKNKIRPIDQEELADLF